MLLCVTVTILPHFSITSCCQWWKIVQHNHGSLSTIVTWALEKLEMSCFTGRNWKRNMMEKLEKKQWLFHAIWKCKKTYWNWYSSLECEDVLTLDICWDLCFVLVKWKSYRISFGQSSCCPCYSLAKSTYRWAIPQGFPVHGSHGFWLGP